MKKLNKEVFDELFDYIGISVSLLICTVLIGIFIFLKFAGSWILTCIVIKLITIYFGLPFSWMIATGIWLILWLLKRTFQK